MSEATRRVRWGVLGCASIATQVMIPAIQSSRNGRVVAVGSRSRATASKVAHDFGIARAHEGYQAVLDDPEVEAVYIPLPNSMHAEWTIKAAEKGKHVLCEKTLALNIDEAREMAAACRGNGVMLMEGFATRFHPQNLLVKRLVTEGRIGRVLHTSSMFSTPRPEASSINLSKPLGGGVLREKGCYCVNLPRFIYGSEPRRVASSIAFGEETGVDERAAVFMQFPGGQDSFFETSYGLTGDTCYQSYELFGERGRIFVPRGVFQLETSLTGALVESSVFVSQDRFLKSETSEQEIVVPGANQWQLEAEYFADRVVDLEGIAFPAESGLHNMAVMDAIYRSALEGRPVELP